MRCSFVLLIASGCLLLGSFIINRMIGCRRSRRRRILLLGCRLMGMRISGIRLLCEIQKSLFYGGMGFFRLGEGGREGVCV